MPKDLMLHSDPQASMMVQTDCEPRETGFFPTTWRAPVCRKLMKLLKQHVPLPPTLYWNAFESYCVVITHYKKLNQHLFQGLGPWLLLKHFNSISLNIQTLNASVRALNKYFHSTFQKTQSDAGSWLSWWWMRRESHCELSCSLFPYCIFSIIFGSYKRILIKYIYFIKHNK